MRALSFTLLPLSVALCAGFACGSEPSAVPSSVDSGRSDAMTEPPPDGGMEPPPVVVMPNTDLPKLPELGVLSASVRGDSVEASVLPFDGARDYRIYELPANADISQQSGRVIVRNATYRCAGNQQAPVVRTDGEQDQASEETHTVVVGDVFGYARTQADSVLGYVFEREGAGRIPVYALGDPSESADIGFFFQRYPETRKKKYTTSSAERDTLLAARWRDDGIAFWTVPTSAGKTQTLYVDLDADFRGPRNLVYPDGAEKSARRATNTAPMFDVLKASEPDAMPLRRVYYRSPSHDELVAGNPRFERARKQGASPLTSLHWSGLSEEKILVIEALAEGCPFGGFHSAKSIPADAPNQAYVTIQEQRAASTSGEIFINGQYASTNVPKAIARAFIKVAPKPLVGLDFVDEFKTFAPLADAPCGRANCFQSYRQVSADYDITWDTVETNGFAVGSVLGELWVAYGDWAQDTGGLFRMTPKRKTTLNANTYLHVTMGVDGVSTGRRYPQIFISDQEAPVQTNLTQGKSLLVQLFGSWPTSYELQICERRTWNVNDQCPKYNFYRPQNLTGPIPPTPEIGPNVGMDRNTTFDVYASTNRAYLFLNGKPYGCADLPSARVPNGPVTVTFGDVLYHSGVDEPVLAGQLPFLKEHQLTETKRHFDNIGFKAGEAQPAWNEAVLPCKPVGALN
jgi:hypothetical protein